jgi:predicted DNA-binding transcriptional regulator YafY
MSEIDRLYRYIELLKQRRVVPRDTFLRELEISPATFKRDLAKLRDRLGTPVRFDRDLAGYCLEAQDASSELPGFWFTQDEMLALLTIQGMIEQLEPGLIGPKLKPLQSRLNHMLESSGLEPSVLMERLRVVHAGKRNMPLATFETLAKATLQRKQVRIEHHMRERNEHLTRTISPQQLVHYRENWYVDAWCHLRKGLRCFSVDAITTAELMDTPAKELDLDVMREQLGKTYGIFGGPATDWAELRFSPQRAPWVRNELWHPDQVGTVLPDGSYLLKVPYSDTRELMGDILKFGPDVQVVGPTSLKAQVAQALEQALKAYRG